jgi:hypothetical protein
MKLSETNQPIHHGMIDIIGARQVTPFCEGPQVSPSLHILPLKPEPQQAWPAAPHLTHANPSATWRQASEAPQVRFPPEPQQAAPSVPQASHFSSSPNPPQVSPVLQVRWKPQQS